jgi:hypothetical protein
MNAINDRTGDCISSCIAVKIQLKTHTSLKNTTKNSYLKIKASWCASKNNDYQVTLIHFMTFMNGIAYAKDHQFIQDKLALLTPDDGCVKRHTAHQNPTLMPTQLEHDPHHSCIGKRQSHTTCRFFLCHGMQSVGKETRQGLLR